MRGGPFVVSLVEDWEPTAGSVLTWQPSPASYEQALEAPIREVPPSFMQAQYLRNHVQYAAEGRNFRRLMVFTVDIPGQCDKRAMSHVINAHLRRHDTYRSWFSLDDQKNFVRRTIANPADIRFVPVKHGEMTTAELRDWTLRTPEPLEWDCFRFGVIQSTGKFTLYLSIDHLHLDLSFTRLLITEFLVGYNTLIQGGAPISLPPAGSYEDFCNQQHQFLSGLTADSPPIREWTEFAENNCGSLPDFPLPLEDESTPLCRTVQAVEQLMDEQQSNQFESVCVKAGGRFIGGVMACLGFVERQLTGADTYYGVTPSDSRTEPDIVSMGWFTGLVPVTVPVDGSFSEAVRAATKSFDNNKKLVEVPFYRALELVPQLSWPRRNHAVVNFIDAGGPPMSQIFTDPLLVDNPIGLYSESRQVHQLTIFVMRMPGETVLFMPHPDNPIARESVARYMMLMKSMFARVCEGLELVPAVAARVQG